MRRGDMAHAVALGQDGKVVDLDERRIRLELPPTASYPDGRTVWAPRTRVQGVGTTRTRT